jgi:hypothetical protein
VTHAVARRDTDRGVREVDVTPAQRDELAAAQARERRREEDRGVLLVGCGAHRGEHLLGRVELQLAAGGVVLARLLDVAIGKIMTPDSAVRILIFVVLLMSSESFQSSTMSVVRSSIRRSPNAGTRCALMIEP